MKNKDITKLFLESVEENSDFKEAVSLVKKNSLGNIWLIGSFLYKNIATKLFGLKNKR